MDEGKLPLEISPSSRGLVKVFILGRKALLIFSLLGLCDQIFMRSTCIFIELFSTFDPWSCPTRAWHQI